MLGRIFILFILFYKAIISPLTPGSCRFYPTCSSYSIEALKKYGFFKGIYLSTKRVLRCNGYVPGGYDPVP